MVVAILLGLILLALLFPRFLISAIGLCIQLALLALGVGVLLGMLHPR